MSLVITDSAGREWRSGDLSAAEIAALMPSIRLLENQIWDTAAMAVWWRVVMALFHEHQPDLTPEKVHDVFRYGDIVPIAAEFQRQVFRVAAPRGRA